MASSLELTLDDGRALRNRRLQIVVDYLDIVFPGGGEFLPRALQPSLNRLITFGVTVHAAAFPALSSDGGFRKIDTASGSDGAPGRRLHVDLEQHADALLGTARPRAFGVP